MKIVVIGASGHVGSYLVPRLIAAGHDVVAVSRGARAPYHDDPAWDDAERVVIDREAQDAAGTFGPTIAALGADVVVDLICFTEDSARQLVDAIRGTVSLLVHVGTIWVHGAPVQVPVSEADPRHPFGDYGTAKAAIERMLHDETRSGGLAATIVHPGHISGPGWRVINPLGNLDLDVWATLASGERLVMPNFGLESVHHVHADDVAQLIQLAIEQPAASTGESFHAVSDRALTLRGFAESVAAWYGREADLEFVPFEQFAATTTPEHAGATWEHMSRNSVMSIEKARTALGYEPAYSSLEAVGEAVDWLRRDGQLPNVPENPPILLTCGVGPPNVGGHPYHCRMARPTTQFRCTECGWTSLKWVGRCGECQQWDTVQDVTASVAAQRLAPIAPTSAARSITDIGAESSAYWPSGIAEFDRVLGGGIVPGAAILLSGEPGVGKSTLLLEVASRAAASGQRVLYVSAEESVSQVRLRAERTGALQSELYLAAETDLATILGQIDQVQPQLVIVDSVQTVSSSLTDGLAGGPAQVRDVASTLIRVSKQRNLPVLLVGHVTKDGSIAGPRLLEHLVDVVLHFEGDRQTALRFVRSHKNRFGPTDEVGCFEMTGEGISEVADPSGLFLSGNRNRAAVSGTCVTIAVEGRRALPVEVQALIVKTQAPQPRRVVNGVDSSRVAMLLAVLERRANLQLSGADVYVSTVGGIRLTEPGADLAIALAIASAFRERALAVTLAAIGEISLAGEIRTASNAKQRSAEARRLGFSTIIDSETPNLKDALRLAFASAVVDRAETPDF